MPDRAGKPASIPITPVAPTPLVSISDDNSRVIATLPAGDRVEVLLYGATVISWKTGEGKECLFLSEKALLDGSKPVRGGIPLVFPAFGPPETGHATGKLPQHGFARSSRWEYLGKTTEEGGRVPGTAGDSSVKLDFGLSHSMLDEGVRGKWPHDFGLTYTVTLSPNELQTSVLVHNTGEEPFEFKTLLHSYFAIDDIASTQVTGLEPTAYIDKVPSAADKPAAGKPISFAGETDRVYVGTAGTIGVVVGKKPVYEIQLEEGLKDAVVWNPWVEKAGGMSDFAPKDGWKKMVCVEAGAVANWTSLGGGETWEGGQRVRRAGA